MKSSGLSLIRRERRPGQGPAVPCALQEVRAGAGVLALGVPARIFMRNPRCCGRLADLRAREAELGGPSVDIHPGNCKEVSEKAASRRLDE